MNTLRALKRESVKSETQSENIDATNSAQENQNDEIRKSYFWYLVIEI